MRGFMQQDEKLISEIRIGILEFESIQFLDTIEQ